MENSKIFIVSSSNASGGGGISLKDYKTVQFFDHGEGPGPIGSIFSYTFKDPHWAVNRKRLKNRFLGEVINSSIIFDSFDAFVRLKEKNLPQNQFVSFSVVLDRNSVYPADIEVVTAEHQFTGKVRRNVISFDDYDGQVIEFKEYKSANLPDGQAVSFSVVLEDDRAYAVNVKAI